MKMSVNGAFLQEMEVLKVDDATIVKQYGKLYLICSVTRQLVSGVVHNLEVSKSKIRFWALFMKSCKLKA